MAHELMENDQMFSVLKTPWHGLGRILGDSPSIDEALIAANLLWKVALLPLYALQQPNGNTLPQHIHTHKAVRREDTGEIFTVVSNKYQPLQNDEAFDVFRPLVEDGSITLETAGSLKNGRKVWILAKISEAKDAEVRDGDIVKPYVMLSNSHDGTQAVRFGFTPIRVVCNNTLSWATEHADSKLLRVYHRGNLRGNLDLLRQSLDTAKVEFSLRADKYRRLAKSNVNQNDLTKYIRAVLQTEDVTPRENAIMDVLFNGRGIGTRPQDRISWWDAYNAINEWMLYHRGRSADSRLASAWFGDGYLLDQTAFRLADDFMAKAA
jgi:phage/plasmid-like protein (TIGR03299 family)